MSSSLVEAREAVANRIFEDFDFGSDVEGSSGWEFETPGAEMARVVFLRDEENPDGPSLRGHLVVRFESDGSAVPTEAYAVVGDTVFGSVGTPLDEMADEATSPSP